MTGGFKPSVWRITNEAKWIAGCIGQYWLLPASLSHPSPLLGRTCCPLVGMEMGPYIAARPVRVRGWRFVLV